MPKKRKLKKIVKPSQNYPNQFEFIFTAQKFENKIKQVEMIRNQIKYRLSKGQVYNILLFLKIGYSETTQRRYRERYDMELPPYFYQAFTWPFNEEPGGPMRIIRWIQSVMRDYRDKAEQVLASNPDYNIRDIYNLRSISLRFFYGKDLPDIVDPEF